MPFGFHGPDLIIILVIALLIFGPKKLPEMGASVGKSIKEFKKGMAELTEPKAEKPAAYETVANESVAPTYTKPAPETYTPAEPVVTSYTASEPVVERYESPASFEAEVQESEVNAQ